MDMHLIILFSEVLGSYLVFEYSDKDVAAKKYICVDAKVASSPCNSVSFHFSIFKGFKY